MRDKDVIKYKRNPEHSEIIRYELVKSCKYVDKVIFDYPLYITQEFLIKNHINYVVHAFKNNDDFVNQLDYFHVPIKNNQFYVLDYNYGVSSSDLIQDLNSWKNIWSKKGTEDTQDLRKLSGYEDTEFNRDDTVDNIIYNLNIQIKDKVLEIGCGAGYIAEKLSKNCDYYGIDYSQNLLTKHYNFSNNHKVLCCQANDLPFKDNYFDKVICNGVFEYFPNINYASQVIQEMKRVSKSAIYILNIRHTTRSEKNEKHKYDGIFTHTVYKPEDNLFNEFKIIDPTFDKENRFSAIKM